MRTRLLHIGSALLAIAVFIVLMVTRVEAAVDPTNPRLKPMPEGTVYFAWNPSIFHELSLDFQYVLWLSKIETYTEQDLIPYKIDLFKGTNPDTRSALLMASELSVMGFKDGDHICGIIAGSNATGHGDRLTPVCDTLPQGFFGITPPEGLTVTVNPAPTP